MLKKLKLSSISIRRFNDAAEYAILILLAAFAIFTIVNAVNAIMIVRPLIGSPSFDNILTHGKSFAYLTALGVLTHSGKTIVVQIAMIRLFSILITEIALLSVIFGLLAFKKVLTYLSFADKAELAVKAAGTPEKVIGAKINSGIVGS